MTNIPEQLRTYAAYLPIPVLMAIREEQAMVAEKIEMPNDEHKMTHEEWARMQSREASRVHVERETELEKLRRDKAALLEACQNALQWMALNTPFNREHTEMADAMDKQRERLRAAIKQAETP